MITTLTLLLFILAAVFALFKCKITSRLTFILGLLGFMGVGYGLVPYFLLKNLETYPIVVKPTWSQNNAIVLLSAGTVRQPINKTSIPSSMAYARIHQAARLYFSCQKSGNRCIIITSGDDILKRGNNVYLNELQSLGIQNKDIIAESRSINTSQNARFSSAILKSQQFSQIFLVTSNIHMKRSLLYFSEFGINAIPAPADYLRAQFTWLPRGYNFAISDAAAHEYVGMLQLYLINFLKDHPLKRGHFGRST